MRAKLNKLHEKTELVDITIHAAAGEIIDSVFKLYKHQFINYVYRHGVFATPIRPLRYVINPPQWGDYWH